MERIPPHNNEAESSVLGAAMLDRDALLNAIERLLPDDFYNKNNGEIFAAMVELQRRNESVDSLTVTEELKKRGALEMVGGRGFIADLPSAIPSAANVGDYIRIIIEKAETRALIKTATQIEEECYNENMDAMEVMDYAEKNIFKIAQKRQKKSATELADILREDVKIIGERAKHKGEFTGVETGFIDLDRKTAGFQKSDLIILAARPSMGKTAFALSAFRNAAEKGHKVLFFSLEMSKEQLSQRLISMESRIDSQKLRTGDLNTEEWQGLIESVEAMSKYPADIDDTPGIKIMEIRNKCRRIKAEKGLDMIIVDYLQLMDVDGRRENRQQEISTLSREFKQLAREMECPVIVLSQLSRQPDQRTDHRPVLSDLRESGAIEQDADVVLFLYRDFFYNPDAEEADKCELILAKQRNGPTGTVNIRWLGNQTKFVNYAEEEVHSSDYKR